MNNNLIIDIMSALKNIMSRLLPTMGILCLMSALSSCSDDEPIPSAIDEKEWTLDNNHDNSYAPGDNFFMFCNGDWWARTDLGDKKATGFMYDEHGVVKQRIGNISDPRVKRFNEQVNNYGNDYDAADRFITARLKEYEGLSMLDATAKFISQGYDDLLYFEPLVESGEIKISITPNKNNPLFAGLQTFRPTLDYTLEHPEIIERMMPISAMRSRAGEDMLEEIVAKLGLRADEVYIDPDNYSVINSTLSTAWTESYHSEIEECIKTFYVFASQACLDDYNKQNGTDYTIGMYIESVRKNYMNHLMSYAYASQYVSQSLKDEYTEICREIKAAFRKRIERLDWMSATTKSHALNKLDKMAMNVGYPEEWHENILAPIDGKSLAENVAQLQKSRFDLIKTLVGKDAQPSTMLLIGGLYSGYNLTVTNAFYYGSTNTINIYPNFLQPPFYDRSQSDAINYAVFAVIGHEMTHGFDSNGANYDEDGNYRNWWTVADKMEFENRQQSLVNCYNHLEIYPEELPGVYCSGEHTLAENIADLGGAQIAFDAYTDYLLNNGYYGDEHEKQQRRFFEGFAELWRCKYTSQLASDGKDTHAQGRERVNGVVMNIDRWYELYDVQPIHRLFLPKERRTYLW